MCVSLPALLLTVDGARGTVQIGPRRRGVSLLAVPEAQPGDYVLVNLGVAVQRLSAGEAAQVLETWEAINAAFDSGA